MDDNDDAPRHDARGDAARLGKSHSNSQLSMEPRREGSRGGRPEQADASFNTNNNKERQAALADKKELDMAMDDIVEQKAFIWACGRNADGELALGTVSKEGEVALPRNVKQLRDFPVRLIAASNNHTAILTPHGDVHVAGASLHGKLGLLGIEKKFLNKFHVVTQLAEQKVVQVCCSDYQTLLLLETPAGRTVHCLGGPNMKDKANLPQDLNESIEVAGLQGKDIVQISCGDYHAAAVDVNGDLYTWGGGKSAQFNKGQCGQGNAEFCEHAKRVEALAEKRVEKVSCGAFHTLVVTEDKQLYAFGSGVYGECGHGDYGNLQVARKIEIPKSKNKASQKDKQAAEVDKLLAGGGGDMMSIIDASAGGKHSMVLTGSGALYTFGFGDQGQLGHRNTDNQKTPTLVQDFDGIKVQAISAGSHHSVVQTAAGDLYACGLNKDGQLGLGHAKAKTQFTHISAFGGINIQRFVASGNHAWFQIDEFLPFAAKYQLPAPLGPQKNQDLRKAKDGGKDGKSQDGSQ